MTVFRKIRLLPLLVIVSFVSFVIRIGDFSGELSRSGTAFAQQETQDNITPPPLPAVRESQDQKKDDTAADGSATAAAPAAESADKPGETATASSADSQPAPEGPVPVNLPALPADGSKADAVKWKDAGEEEFEFSPVQASLYKDLATRRKDLDTREQALATREALLKAGERELDQKLRELTTVRNEIEGLLKKQTDEEKNRVNSLVKIYEGMKPADAANIFNTLDVDVLMTVLNGMSERKSAAVMAEMNPDRARTVTILMAQQQKLPSLPMQ